MVRPAAGVGPMCVFARPRRIHVTYMVYVEPELIAAGQYMHDTVMLTAHI